MAGKRRLGPLHLDAKKRYRKTGPKRISSVGKGYYIKEPTKLGRKFNRKPTVYVAALPMNKSEKRMAWKSVGAQATSGALQMGAQASLGRGSNALYVGNSRHAGAHVAGAFAQGIGSDVAGHRAHTLSQAALSSNLHRTLNGTDIKKGSFEEGSMGRYATAGGRRAHLKVIGRKRFSKNRSAFTTYSKQIKSGKRIRVRRKR